MDPRKSIDYGGVGQSGFCAGRHEHDVALEVEIEVRNKTCRRGSDAPAVHELDTDDRWSGRGGAVASIDHGETSR